MIEQPEDMDVNNDGNANGNIDEPARADDDDDVPDRVDAGPAAGAVEEVEEIEEIADEWHDAGIDELARRHSDEVLNAVRADGVNLQPVDAKRLAFFANVIFRLDRYRATGQEDQVL